MQLDCSAAGKSLEQSIGKRLNIQTDHSSLGVSEIVDEQSLIHI